MEYPVVQPVHLKHLIVPTAPLLPELVHRVLIIQHSVTTTVLHVAVFDVLIAGLQDVISQTQVVIMQLIQIAILFGFGRVIKMLMHLR